MLQDLAGQMAEESKILCPPLVLAKGLIVHDRLTTWPLPFTGADPLANFSAVSGH